MRIPHARCASTRWLSKGNSPKNSPNISAQVALSGAFRACRMHESQPRCSASCAKSARSHLTTDQEVGDSNSPGRVSYVLVIACFRRLQGSAPTWGDRKTLRTFSDTRRTVPLRGSSSACEIWPAGGILWWGSTATPAWPNLRNTAQPALGWGCDLIGGFRDRGFAKYRVMCNSE